MPPPVSSRSGKQCGQVDCGGILLGSSCFSDSSHFQLKVTFHLKQKRFPLEAVLDLGVAENFIDLNLASQLHISLTPVNHLFLSLGRRTPSPTTTPFSSRPNQFACPSGTTRSRSSFSWSLLHPLLSSWANVSDRGPRFTASFWKVFCSLIGASSSLRSGYHP